MPEAEASAPVSAAPRKSEPFFYGGQAAIEGVLMRGKRHYAVAVRLPTTKQIVVDRGELKAAIYVNPFWKLPFVRGLALIGEQLHLGMKALVWSANMNAGSQGVEIGKKEIRSSVAVAAVFGLLIFIGLPLLLAGLAVHRSNGFGFVLVEGVIGSAREPASPALRHGLPARRPGGQRDHLLGGGAGPPQLVLADHEPRARAPSHRRGRLRAHPIHGPPPHQPGREGAPAAGPWDAEVHDPRTVR